MTTKEAVEYLKEVYEVGLKWFPEHGGPNKINTAIGTVLESYKKADKLLAEYAEVRKEMLEIEKGYSKNTYCEHLNLYFSFKRSEPFSDITFDEYCVKILGLSSVCPKCNAVFNQVKRHQELAKRLGVIKRRMVRYGI